MLGIGSHQGRDWIVARRINHHGRQKVIFCPPVSLLTWLGATTNLLAPTTAAIGSDTQTLEGRPP